MLRARIFERVADAAGTLTAAAPSICVHTRPYRVAWMLNQLRRGHRCGHVLAKSGTAMAAPAAPDFGELDIILLFEVVSSSLQSCNIHSCIILLSTTPL